MAGHAFEEYDGPMREWTRWCFVCGDSSTHAMRVESSGQLFGICRTHLEYAHSLRAVGVPSLSGAKIAPRGGGLVPVEQLVSRPRKTLAMAIAETEAEFAKEAQCSK